MPGTLVVGVPGATTCADHSPSGTGRTHKPSVAAPLVARRSTGRVGGGVSVASAPMNFRGYLTPLCYWSAGKAD
jgi:hypothetical protein